MSAANAQVAAPGPWAPLAQPTFRSLWLAILFGNVGTWMQDVAAAWVMAERTGSALWVGAVQAATTLPVVLFALLAGAMADIVDRRRLLIVTQLWMFSVASALALLAQTEMLQPWSLLALTFALGTGAAMAMPAQAAITPELVPRTMLAPALALNSVGMNIARSLGPAIGGVVVAQLGASWAFAVNAVSFLGVAWVLWRWRRQPSAATLPPEHFGSALAAGVRYAARASVFQAVLVKAAGFFLFASALPALLPIVVRSELAGGPGTFGLLLGCIGVGAIVGAVVLPRLRSRLDRDVLVMAASLLCAATLLGLSLVRQPQLLGLVMAVNGVAWITVLSSLQIAAQTSVPAWVRARALSLYIVVFALGMATGSLAWGGLAQITSTSVALTAAAIALVASALLTLRFRMSGAEALDLSPSRHWDAPESDGVTHDRGPVLVTLEYRIDDVDLDAFLQVMKLLGDSRRRDGAVQWGVVEDTAQPGTWLEYFLVPSWLEHLRQHDRVTAEDRKLQDRLRELHRDVAPILVRHFAGSTAAQRAEEWTSSNPDGAMS